jgi:chromosome segregation ATPase
VDAPNVVELRQLHEEHVQRLQKESERVYEQMDALKEQLRATKEQMQDAVIKRDEYKETLRDIITQYKQLHAEHESAGVQMKELQTQVDELKQALSKKESEPVKQEGNACTAIVPASDKPVNENDEEEASPLTGAPEDEAAEDPTRLQDVIKAYSRAMEKIASLENRLAAAEEEANATRELKDTGDRNYRDAINRYKKMEAERNNFQRMMDKAAEETRLAKMEAQREREEARHVRRRLTFYMRNQHKQDGGGVPLHTLESLALSPTILSLTAGGYNKGTTYNAPNWNPILALPDLEGKSTSVDASVTSAIDVAQIMLERDALKAEKARLERENEELTDFCKEVLKEVEKKEGTTA